MEAVNQICLHSRHEIRLRVIGVARASLYRKSPVNGPTLPGFGERFVRPYEHCVSQLLKLQNGAAGGKGGHC
jgi:hypothetical protein